MFHKRNYHKQRESPGQNLNIATREKISRPHLRLVGKFQTRPSCNFSGRIYRLFQLTPVPELNPP
jgi:hypothetical protein